MINVLTAVSYLFRQCSLAYVLTHVLDNAAMITIASIDTTIEIYNVINHDNQDISEIEELILVLAFVISICIVVTKPKPVTVVWIILPFVFCFLTFE